MSKQKYIEAKNLSLIQGSPDAIVAFDKNFVVTQWNPKAAIMFGYSSAEAIGTNIFDLITTQGVITTDLEAFEACLKGIEHTQHLLPRKSRSAKWMVISSKLIPVRDKNGKVTSGMVVFKDFTNEAHEKQVLREALTIAKMGHFEILMEKGFNFIVSKELHAMLAAKEEAIDISSYSLFISYFGSGCAKRLKEAFERSAGSGESGSLEVTRIHLDGETSTYKLSYEAEVREKRTNRIYGVMQDITDQVKQKKQIEKQQVQLMGKNRMAALGQLSAGVAHEINNPMAIISGLIQMLKTEVSQEKPRKEILDKFLGKIDNASQRVCVIVASLRSFASESDDKPFEEVEVADIIRDATSLCRERLEQHNISLNIREIPKGTFIACRPSKIAQVILNLLINAHDAVQFRAGDNYVNLSVTQKEDGGVRIVVEDSGDGIPEEIRDKIMEPFFTTKAVGKGTGVGLSLAQGIMQDHLGEIYLDETSKKTRFVLEFPPPRKLFDLKSVG